jgi:hypothetical protein
VQASELHREISLLSIITCGGDSDTHLQLLACVSYFS